MEKRTVPKYIVKAVNDLKKYHDLHIKAFDILFEWAKKEDLVSDDQESIKDFNGGYWSNFTEIEQGNYTGEEFKQEMEC